MLRATLLSALISSVFSTKLVGYGICGREFKGGFLTDRCYNVESNGMAGTSSVMIQEVTEKQQDGSAAIGIQFFSDNDCGTPSSSFNVPSGVCHDGLMGPNTVWMITDDDCGDYPSEMHPVRILEMEKHYGSQCSSSQTTDSILLEGNCEDSEDSEGEHVFNQWICGPDGSATLRFDIHHGEDSMCAYSPISSTTFFSGECITDGDDDASYQVSCSPVYCPIPPQIPSAAPVLVSIGNCGSDRLDTHMLTERCYNMGPSSQMVFFSDGIVQVLLFAGRDCDHATGVTGYAMQEGFCHSGVAGENTAFSVTQCFDMSQNKQAEPNMPMLQYAEFEAFIGQSCMPVYPSSLIGNLAGACEMEDEGQRAVYTCEANAVSRAEFDGMCTSDPVATTYLPYNQCSSMGEGSIIPQCLPITCPAPETPPPAPLCHDHNEVLAYFASLYGVDLNQDCACEEFAKYNMCNDNHYGELVAIVCPVSCGRGDQDEELRSLVDQYTEYAGMIDSCARAVAMAENGCFNTEYGSYLQALCPCACNDNVLSFIGGADSSMPVVQPQKSIVATAPVSEKTVKSIGSSDLALTESEIEDLLIQHGSVSNKSAVHFKVSKSAPSFNLRK